MGKKKNIALWKRLKTISSLTFAKIMDPFYAGGAAEIAFFLILSFVPTTILLAQFLNVFTLSMNAIRELIKEYFQEDVQNVLLPLLNYHPSNTFSILLFILALWAGSKALFSLMRMSNYAYRGGSGYRNPVLGYIRERIRALTTVILILLTIVFALYILVFGEVIVQGVLKYLNDFLEMDYSYSSVWYTVRWIIAFVLYLLMVIIINYMLPHRKGNYSRMLTKGFFRSLRNIVAAWLRNSRETMRMIFPGSLFSAIGMLIATWLYSFYMDWVSSKASNFNILYGSLSSIVVLLLWFYVLAFVLIIGIQLNGAIAQSKDAIKREGRSGR
ncbi:MAG: YihY/virulence factor BrkB family protein [Clostridiales Family XIII bacterium]|jgi:membrane protein|nr:YihY/virulence factor BrkB family protein [Clostridiales Family XIII bacterium]